MLLLQPKGLQTESLSLGFEVLLQLVRRRLGAQVCRWDPLTCGRWRFRSRCGRQRDERLLSRALEVKTVSRSLQSLHKGQRSMIPAISVCRRALLQLQHRVLLIFKLLTACSGAHQLFGAAGSRQSGGTVAAVVDQFKLHLIMSKCHVNVPEFACQCTAAAPP